MRSPALKTYDVRGEYPQEVNLALTTEFISALVRTFGARIVVIGYDARPASLELYSTAVLAATREGADVIAIGKVTTEMVTFAVATGELDMHNADLGVMITASHNPITQTGFKVIGPEGAPIAPEDMARVYEAMGPVTSAVVRTPGQVASWSNLLRDYVAFMVNTLTPYGDWPIDPGKPKFKVVVDPGLSVSGHAFTLIFTKLKMKEKISFTWLTDYDKEAKGYTDPTCLQATDAMGRAIRALEADLGLAWDADGDRLIAYDKFGQIINGAYLGAYIGAAVTQKNPKAPVAVDQRVVFAMNSLAAMANVPLAIGFPGHALMKNLMRQEAACFGAELSGHYYFSEFWWADSGMLAAFLTLHMAFLSPIPLHDVIKHMEECFPIRGEYSYPVSAPATVIAAVKASIETVATTTITNGELVARSMDKNSDWRFCLRASNTENSLLRLTLEGVGNRAELFEVMKVVKAMIFTFSEASMEGVNHG